MSKLKIIFIFALLLVSGSVALAASTIPATFGECTAAEKLAIPGCNPPINNSVVDQVKSGGLSVKGFIATASALIGGKLGVGASSPGPKLYVQDAGADWLSLALFKNTITTGVAGMTFNAGGSDGFWGMNGPGRSVNPNQFFMGNGNTDGGFLFFTGGGGVANERMRITSTGNVGIGTTTPSTKLAVVGSVTIADGTQGAGKVLTSDASGKTSWKAGSSVSIPAYSLSNLNSVSGVYTTNVNNIEVASCSSSGSGAILTCTLSVSEGVPLMYMKYRVGLTGIIYSKTIKGSQVIASGTAGAGSFCVLTNLSESDETYNWKTMAYKVSGLVKNSSGNLISCESSSFR